MSDLPASLIALNPYEARLAEAVFERTFPAGPHGPGAAEIGVVSYLDQALAGAYRDLSETYRVGLSALDRAARDAHGRSFCDCTPEHQDALLGALEQGTLAGF